MEWWNVVYIYMINLRLIQEVHFMNLPTLKENSDLFLVIEKTWDFNIKNSDLFLLVKKTWDFKKKNQICFYLLRKHKILITKFRYVFIYQKTWDLKKKI